MIRYIYQHLLDEGWLQPGDVVLDPFGGIALGARPALRMGLHWVGVELEQPFCDLGQGCDCTGISQADWVRFFGRWERVRYLDGRYWCPKCVADAKVVIERKHTGQLSMFDDAPLSTSYIRNSGRIPYTEPHHYAGNIERWADIARNGASAVLLQGDSRYLLDVVGEAGGLISSPPWQNQLPSHDDFIAPHQQAEHGRNENAPSVTGRFYGTNPANLGNMPAGDPGDRHGVDAVIASPPWADSLDRGVVDKDARVRQARSMGISNAEHISPIDMENVGLRTQPDYGSTPGQLAAMPPGQSPGTGQVADGLVSSPPYEGSAVALQDGAAKRQLENLRKAVASGAVTGRESIRVAKLGKFNPNTNLNSSGGNYGISDGQLGQESGPTFWSAARAIVSQCYHVLKPGAVAVWVVKRFVRDKQIVEFSQQWADLCQSCGFELVHWHRAMLVEDGGTQLGLMGEDEHKVKKRYSFFRRLHAQKYPHLEIQWEDVLCMRKVT